MKSSARQYSLASWSAQFWPWLVILLAILPVYGWSLSFGFLSWDDDQNITQNTWLLKGEWSRFWFEHFVGMYVPLVYTIWYALSKLGSGVDPLWFHACNVVMHGMNAALVFLLAQRLTGPEEKSLLRTQVVSCVAALIFALHPLQVESVAWVTGLRDVLSTSLVLIAGIVSLYRGFNLGRELIAFVLFASSLLCKPSAAVVPVAFGLLALAYGFCDWRRVIIKFGPWLALGLIAVITTKDIQTEVISFAVPDLDLASRLLVVLDSYGFYLSKLLWPFGLAVDYGRAPEKMIAGNLFVSTISLLMVAISGLLACYRWLRPRDIVWVLFAAIMLAPTSGLVRFAYQHVSTVADHYMYLPLAGVALFVASVLNRMNGWMILSAFILLTLVYGALSIHRMRIWESDKTLFPAMLAANPDSYGGHIGMVAIAIREERYNDALPNLREAERLEPTNVVTLLDKWLLYVKLGRFKEVVDDKPGHMLTREQIRANPNSASTIAGQYVVLAYAQMKLGDFKGSFETSCLARFADPDHPDLPKFFPFLGERLGLSLPAERWCPQ